jgi:hypothetical protein
LFNKIFYDLLINPLVEPSDFLFIDARLPLPENLELSFNLIAVGSIDLQDPHTNKLQMGARDKRFVDTLSALLTYALHLWGA